MSDIGAYTSSPFVPALEPITETNAEIAAKLEQAELPPLLPALVYLTGDMTLLRDEYRLDPLLAALPQSGLSDEQQAGIRELALETLVAYRDAGCVPAPIPSDDEVLQMMEYAVGGSGMKAYLPLVEEELAHRGADPRAPGWQQSEIAPERNFSVLVVGAGMSGLLAGHRLQQAGVDFVIVDKNPDVGGTWFENKYPGCRVDNPNHNYSYSFAERHDWPFHYSTQDILLGYLRDCADAFDVRDKTRFGVAVESATWSEVDQHWVVELRTATGAETVTANAVISAVGQLNRPLMPDIVGIDRFAGPSWHSACWNDDVDLTGKKVIVIGTGASAVQLIPEIAKVVGQLTVFQRTPPWMAPTPDYHDEVQAGLQWLYGHVPSYSEWNRFCIFWRMGDGSLDMVRVDPDYEGLPHAINPTSEMVRQMLTGYLQDQFAPRPDLVDKVVPDYPVGAKRMLRDNGIWPETLMRDNVALVSDPIREITESGVVMEDGTVFEADVIIYGTGFQASKFLTPMKVTGRDGLDLHEQWGGDARAYLGVTVPNFPNLFCIYGPNTNIVVNGSIVYFSECGVRYIMGLLRLLFERDASALDVRKEVHDAFNEDVDAANRLMAWGWSDVNSWYKAESGRVAQNWPFTLLEYWERTRDPSADDFEFVS